MKTPSLLLTLAMCMSVSARATERVTEQQQLPMQMLSLLAALQDIEVAEEADAAPVAALERPLEEMPPHQQPSAVSEAFSEVSEMTLRPRRSRKSRRRGGLSLDEDEYQLWLRSGECQRSARGETQFFCPSPDRAGDWHCVPASSLCNGVYDCPGREDEQGTGCLFYRAISQKLTDVSHQLLKLTSHHRNHPRKKEHTNR